MREKKYTNNKNIHKENKFDKTRNKNCNISNIIAKYIKTDNDDNNNNSDNELEYNNEIQYINSKFISYIKNRKNINTNEIIKINVEGDGNCLMRCLAVFVYKNENMHIKVRSDIVEYLNKHKNDYIDIEFDTEDGKKNINEYIKYISNLYVWGGELEKYAAQAIYKINIADYQAIKNKKGDIMYHRFIYSLNQDNNYEKDLCIITNINGNHFNILFDKKYNCFLNINKFYFY